MDPTGPPPSAEQLQNEILSLKQSLTRVSKRLLELEDFIKSKFQDEFQSRLEESEPHPLESPQNADFRTLPTPLSTLSTSPSKNTTEMTTTATTSVSSSKQRISPSVNMIRLATAMTSEKGFVDIAKILFPESDIQKVSEEQVKTQPTDDAAIKLESEDSDADFENDEEFENDAVDNTPLILRVPRKNETRTNPPRRNSTPRGSTEKKSSILSNPNVIQKGKDLICGICQKVFSGHKNIRNHLDIHNDTRRFRCPFCPSTFRQRRPRRSHILRVHEKSSKFKCQHCTKAFHSLREQISHERVHTGEKPFSCDQCSYSSTQPMNLSRHKRTKHGTEKDYLCFQCGKGFAFRYDLKTHETTIHDESRPTRGKREKIISCDVCSKMFCEKRNLTKHINTFHPEYHSEIRDSSAVEFHVDIEMEEIKSTTDKECQKS